ncbi:MAG: DUF4838 domain-containing protein [Lentisphaeria bacterium]|jgi:hypothetical protein
MKRRAALWPVRLSRIFLSLIFLSIPFVHAAETTLARDGNAAMSVVLSADAGESLQTVAAELADYLSRMSLRPGSGQAGAEFAVTHGDGAGGIVLGTLEQFPQYRSAELEEALEIRNGIDGKEAYVIRTEPERVLLLGNTETGASHAAFRLLEELGCRWFFPAPEWEVIPEPAAKLTVDLHIDDRPAILARNLWYQWGFFERGGRCQADFDAWSRRNRRAASFEVSIRHAWDGIITGYKDAFDAHPEYLALHITRDPETGAETGRERGGSKFCVSNPGLVEICKRYALDYFKERPDADMVSMDPSDGGGHCECDGCAAMGSVSNRVFYLVNEVAKAVAAAYPGKMVGSLAYNFHSEPPEFELEPNVYVMLTSGMLRGPYSHGELMEMWPKKCKSMGYYEYYSVYQWNQDMLPGGFGGNVSHHRKAIPDFHKNNATCLMPESGNNWGVHGRGYFVANRLMWDPEVDVDAILAEFYDKAFGPAAEAMQRYYERVAVDNEPILGNNLLALAYRDIEEATTLAKDRPDILARLDHLKIYLRYVHLRWMLDREPDTAKVKAQWEQIFAHVYRSRYTYMNHWEAIRNFQTNKTATELNEPTWAGSGAEAPWLGKPPYANAEIAEFFAAGLEYFQPQALEERTYSDDLVPVRFEPIPSAPNVPRNMLHRPVRYAMYSVNGAPLELSVTTGLIAHYRDRPDAGYTVTNPLDEIIVKGRLPLDGESHQLRIEVPAAGRYFLDFDDSGAGFHVGAPGDQPLTLLLRRRGFTHHGWGKDYRFYVPKGLMQVVYYFSGRAHKVNGPDGRVLRTVTGEESGSYITVPVPPGADGRVWRFSEFCIGTIWFTNVPNYIAGTANALMVPREVAIADGLRIRTGGQADRVAAEHEAKPDRVAASRGAAETAGGNPEANERFEVAAWIDHYDFALPLDTETLEGLEAILDHAQEAGVTTIWWRTHAGGRLRFRNNVDQGYHHGSTIDKRITFDNRDVYGWVRYGETEFDMLEEVVRMCRERGLKVGVHWPFEEVHWHLVSLGEFNAEHPQYWGRDQHGNLFMGNCSIAYEAVVQHKLALLDEMLARGIDVVYIDFMRTTFNPRFQYVDLATSTFRGGAWNPHAFSFVTAYMRHVRARLDATGRDLELVAGIPNPNPNAADTSNGFDWRRWIDEEIIDSLNVIWVAWADNDPFGSTQRIYSAFAQTLGDRCRVIVPIRQYNHYATRGMPAYERQTGKTQAEVAVELMRIAHGAGAHGVAFECLDWNNYVPETRQALKALAEGECRYRIVR